MNKINNALIKDNVQDETLDPKLIEKYTVCSKCGWIYPTDNMNAKNLIILNSEDLSKGLITVKDNVTKEEVKVPEDEIIDYILGVI